MLDPRAGICLFTDGSAWTKDRSGGWAWVAFDIHDTEIVGSGSASDTTISRMELTAAVLGLNAVYDDCGSAPVLVYSDSEYVVLGAMNPKRKRRKNVDIWMALDEARSLHSYTEFNHVRGHDTSYYNHMVDEMAGEARRAGQHVA
jgi:ribonuclease HI